MMTLSVHALGHVTVILKKCKAPRQITLSGIFSLIWYEFNFNPHFAMHRFCLISKRSNFKENFKVHVLKNS